MQMVAWSIVAASQARLNGRTSFYIARWLLGIFEGGYVSFRFFFRSQERELHREIAPWTYIGLCSFSHCLDIYVTSEGTLMH